jgi:hypothetical protein
MSATKVFGAAIALGVIGRWANNKKALPSPAGTLEVIGALFLVSFMDKGKTEPIAKGLAWLFMAAVLLSDSSPLTGLARAEGYSPAPGTVPPGAIGPTVLPPTETGNYGSAPSPAGNTSPTGTGYTARAIPTPRRTP